MKTVKEVIELVNKEREKALDGGFGHTAVILDRVEDALLVLRSYEPPVKIGGEVYAVLMPMIPELDGPAKVRSWEVRGVGEFKDGTKFVVNNDGEVYKLDDEEEGVAFSSKERAEKFLKKMQGF